MPDKEGAARKGGSRDFAGQGSSPLQDTWQDEDTAQLDLESYRQCFAERARDTGLQTAERNDREWCERVSEWIYDLPPGFEFTADDIRREHGSSKAAGSVIRTAAHRRVILRAGFTESKAVSRHGGTIRVWVRT